MIKIKLTPARSAEIASAAGIKNDEKLIEKIQLRAEEILKIYKSGDFMCAWPAPDMAIATAIFRTVHTQNLPKPSKRVLREILINASDYEKILKPIKKEILLFIKQTSKYSKIKHEMEIFARLGKREQNARKMYVNFLFSVLTNLNGSKLVKTQDNDVNMLYMHSLASDILKNTPKKSSEEATLIWLKRNMKLLDHLWSTKFKEFK